MDIPFQKYLIMQAQQALQIMAATAPIDPRILRNMRIENGKRRRKPNTCRTRVTIFYREDGDHERVLVEPLNRPVDPKTHFDWRKNSKKGLGRPAWTYRGQRRALQAKLAKQAKRRA